MFSGSAPEAVDVLICPPLTLLREFSMGFSDDGFEFGAQDCHAAQSGAHTGDISAQMVVDAGGSHVIVGHSERRADHQESDAIVKAKAEAAQGAGLIPIVCVGESETARDAGHAEKTVLAQLAGSLPEDRNGLVVAYEPIWAIGTGKTASTDDIAEMHAAIRRIVGDKVRILYGGSVKPDNASKILATANVNGALVGGASLKAVEFAAIIQAADA
ncbi:MAG: triose-phosphate isomerase [Pseudomonadota bacterium]